MTSFLLAFLVPAWGADQDVDSKIITAVVYSDRARITRETKVTVPAGRTDLVFDGLPVHLLPESMSAEGEGVADATLTGIDIRPQRGVEDRDEKVAALKRELQDQQDKIADQQDVVARVQGEITYLRSLKPSAPAKLDQDTFLADDAHVQLADLSQQIGTDLQSLYVEQRAAERVIRDLQKEVNRINRELAKLSSAGNQDSMRVAVGIDARRAGSVTVRLDYIVSGASWSPRYDARYNLNSGKVQLDLSAQVRQNTGESWDNIQLTLSTARPGQGTAPPQLNPFTLQQAYGGSRPGVGGLGSSGSGRGGGGYGGDMDFSNAAIADRVAAVEFSPRTREDVPSDGTVRRVYLNTLQLEGEVIHQVVARRLEAAWLSAKVTNSADYALLPGPVSSYLGTAYVGEGQVALTVPGEDLHLSFGVDDRVGVKRVPIENLSTEGKGLANRDRREWGFRTTVKNRTGKSIQLQVHDQVPVSQEAAWVIKPTTLPEVEMPSTGLFTWKATVPNQGEQVFELKYELSWPKGDVPVFLD